MNKAVKFLLVAGLCLFLPGIFKVEGDVVVPAVNPASSEDTVLVKYYSKIDSFITQLNLKGSFNGHLLVAQDGKIIYNKALGFANYSSFDTLKNDYAYQLASVSKPITAAAVMLLYQDGLIDLEDKIVKYLPELMIYHNVKIKHLLHQTSGLPEYIYGLTSTWNKSTYMSNDDLLAIMARRNAKLAFAPGKRFHYCNTNYALLAKIVERVSDQPFDEFAKQRIFDPLEMRNTYIFNPAKDTLVCRKINGYFWNGRSYSEMNCDYRNGVVGDKGAFSTAEDMWRFAESFYTEKILCNETIARTQQKGTLTTGTEIEYACGWRIRQMDGRQAILHYGFWNNFRTGVIRFPETRTTFVILNNTTGPAKSRINNRELVISNLMGIMFPGTGNPILVNEPAIAPPGLPEEGGAGE